MKRKALEEVVQRHIGDIKKYSHHLPGSFEQEVIHDLRVGYKKIRAFLRLLQLENDAGDLAIPVKLKTVYHACGNVRDVQLFLNEMTHTFIMPSLPAFMSCIRRQLFAHKEHAVQAIEAIGFKKTIERIIGKLPRRLQDDTVHKFIHQKIAAIHIILLAAESENDLHAIRKHLKDIIYTVRLFEQDWGIPFPAADWINEQELTSIATCLGNFNDRCIAVSLLQSPHCSDACGEEERSALQHLQNNWLHQKEVQQQQLLQQVQQLHLEHKPLSV